MIEINLLPEESKSKVSKLSGISGLPSVDPVYFLYALPVVFAALVLAHLLLGMFGIFRGSELSGLSKKWQSLDEERKIVEEFKNQYFGFSQEGQALKKIAGQRVNWSQKMNILSQVVPSGVWFNEIRVTAKDFNLKGSAVSLQKEELGLVNKLIDGLKADGAFFNDFQTLELGPLQRRALGGYDIVDFNLSGSLKAK